MLAQVITGDCHALIEQIDAVLHLLRNASTWMGIDKEGVGECESSEARVVARQVSSYQEKMGQS